MTKAEDYRRAAAELMAWAIQAQADAERDRSLEKAKALLDEARLEGRPDPAPDADD